MDYKEPQFTDLRDIPKAPISYQVFGIRQTIKYRSKSSTMNDENHFSVVFNKKFGVLEKELLQDNYVITSVDLTGTREEFYIQFTFLDESICWCTAQEFYALNRVLNTSREGKTFIWYDIVGQYNQPELHIRYK